MKAIQFGFHVRTARFLRDVALVRSRAEAERLVEQGAIDKNNEAQGKEMIIFSGDLLRVGKHQFVQVYFEQPPPDGQRMFSHHPALHLRCTNLQDVDAWPEFEVVQ